MPRIKAVQLAFNEALPERLRDYGRDIDAKTINDVLADIAKTESPDTYAKALKAIADVGRHASFYQGETVTLNDLRPPMDVDSVYGQMDQEIADARKKFSNRAEFEKARDAIWQTYNKRIEADAMKAGLASGNGLAYAVASGARGKADHFKAMTATPGLFADANGKLVPLFVRRSYGQGLRPAEWLATTYGARTAVISTKSCLLQGTQVRMADGSTRSIEDLRVGDVVLGANADGCVFPSRVVTVYDQGLQKVYRWSFRVRTSRKNKLQLYATEDHKLLATSLRLYDKLSSRRRRKGDVSSQELRQAYHAKSITALGCDDYRFAAVLPTAALRREGGVSNPYAMLLGLLAGDGCISASTQRAGTRLLISCADASLAEDVAPYLKSLGLRWRSHKAYNYTCEIVRESYDRSAHARARVKTGVQGFAEAPVFPEKQALIDSGMKGKYAHEKTLPAGFYSWDDQSQDAYLAGLLATDGSFCEQGGCFGFRLALTSRALVHQVSEVLLWRYGVLTFPQEEKMITRNGRKDARKNSLWVIAVNAFSDMCKLGQIFAQIPGSKGSDVRSGLNGRTLSQDNPYTKAYVKREEFVGHLPCFDIEVDNPDHLFVLANGLIVSNSTAKGGALSKMMSQAAAPLVVTTKDCGVQNGIDLDVGDKSLRGRVLARPVAGFDAGTVIDRDVINTAKKKGAEAIIARSPLTCQAKEGICARCAGLKPEGVFPKVGESVGTTAANALGEPITQSALNVKHTGGMAASQRTYGGFSWINQFMQSPETFQDKAAVAHKAGVVQEIRPAPQGGSYVVQGGEEYYVPPGFNALVKPGQSVEAGDQLAEGLVDPYDVVALRGLGEGRRYYTDRLMKILADSGMPADRRNVEMMARATLDHVRVKDDTELEGVLPDDVVSYQSMLTRYRPPATAKPVGVDDAVGKYLQQPALHYTIGTALTPRMAERLKSRGYDKVWIDDTPPPFEPEMVRLAAASHNTEDWLAAQNTSYLSKQIKERAIRGQDTNVKENVNFAPRLAYGEGFAKNIEQTGKF